MKIKLKKLYSQNPLAVLVSVKIVTMIDTTTVFRDLPLWWRENPILIQDLQKMDWNILDVSGKFLYVNAFTCLLLMIYKTHIYEK